MTLDERGLKASELFKSDPYIGHGVDEGQLTFDKSLALDANDSQRNLLFSQEDMEIGRSTERPTAIES